MLGFKWLGIVWCLVRFIATKYLWLTCFIFPSFLPWSLHYRMNHMISNDMYLHMVVRKTKKCTENIWKFADF